MGKGRGVLGNAVIPATRTVRVVRIQRRLLAAHAQQAGGLYGAPLVVVTAQQAAKAAAAQRGAARRGEEVRRGERG